MSVARDLTFLLRITDAVSFQSFGWTPFRAQGQSPLPIMLNFTECVTGSPPLAVK